MSLYRREQLGLTAAMKELAPLDIFEMGATSGATHSVVWMHGLGASNRDFESIVPELRLPNVRFLFPAAPTRRVTVNGGMAMPAWYDIVSWQDPPLRENEDDVRQAALAIERLLESEQTRGVASERIFIAGFSQGAAMALAVGTRYKRRLAGIISLSGYMVLPKSFDEERTPENGKTPTLMCHGSFDPVVPTVLGRQAYEAMHQRGYPVRFEEYPMAHSLCMEEVVDVRDFMVSCMGSSSLVT